MCFLRCVCAEGAAVDSSLAVVFAEALEAALHYF